jgi:hypothetical protein
MIRTTADISVRDAAMELVRDNVRYEPGIVRVYLFPASDEIRLVEIDRNSADAETVQPFYFSAYPAGGIPYRTALALITPADERRRPALPEGWPDWDAAEVIWETTDGTHD